MTRLRLRDGESNLLAGLLREQDRQTLTGFPGLMRLPILRQLFSATDRSVQTTDIVMLLTPRIVRGHELTQQHVSPIHIGAGANIGLTGPPLTITAAAGATADATPAAPAPAADEQPAAAAAAPHTGDLPVTGEPDAASPRGDPPAPAAGGPDR